MYKITKSVLELEEIFSYFVIHIITLCFNGLTWRLTHSLKLSTLETIFQKRCVDGKLENGNKR